MERCGAWMTLDERFRHTATVPALALAVAADGRSLVTGDTAGLLVQLEADGRERWRYTCGSAIRGLAISRRGDAVYTALAYGTLRRFTGEGVPKWQQEVAHELHSVALDASGRYLAVGTDRAVALFITDGLEMCEHVTGHPVQDVALTRAAARVVAVHDEFVEQFDHNTETLWKRHPGRTKKPLTGVALAADGTALYVAADEGGLCRYDAAGAQAWVLELGARPTTLTILPEGVLVATAAGELHRYDSTGERHATRRPGGNLACVDASGRAELVAVGGDAGVVAYRLFVPEAVSPAHEGSMPEGAPTGADEPEASALFGMFDAPLSIDPTVAPTGPERSSSVSCGEGDAMSSSSTGDGGCGDMAYPAGDTDSRPHVPPRLRGASKYREFVYDLKIRDVNNYLKLGKIAFREGRFAQAETYYKHATEIDSNEPRGWYNLAVCRYRKRLAERPDDLKRAIFEATEPLQELKRKFPDYELAELVLKYFHAKLDDQERQRKS